MAITPRNVGAWVVGTSTTQAVTLPAHVAGDMLLVRCARKPFTTGTDITCATAGWAAVGAGFANGSTAAAAGAGSFRARAFWKIATSSAEPNPTITWGTTAAPGAVCPVVYQCASDEQFLGAPTGAGGGDATSRTAQTATIGSHIPVQAGDLIDFFDYHTVNAALTVPVITQAGVTYSATSEYPTTALATNTSNDMSADGGYRTATAGTSSAAAVVTWTAATTGQGGAWQTRLRVAQAVALVATGGGAAVVAAQRIEPEVHSAAVVATGGGTFQWDEFTTTRTSAPVVTGGGAAAVARATTRTRAMVASGGGVAVVVGQVVLPAEEHEGSVVATGGGAAQAAVRKIASRAGATTGGGRAALDYRTTVHLAAAASGGGVTVATGTKRAGGGAAARGGGVTAWVRSSVHTASIQGTGGGVATVVATDIQAAFAAGAPKATGSGAAVLGVFHLGGAALAATGGGRATATSLRSVSGGPSATGGGGAVSAALSVRRASPVASGGGAAAVFAGALTGGVDPGTVATPSRWPAVTPEPWVPLLAAAHTGRGIVIPHVGARISTAESGRRVT